MGILAQTLQEDVRLINWVAEITAGAWELHAAKNPAFRGCSVRVNTDLTEDLSLFGDRLLAKYFPNAGLYDRVATLCVLANCCPFFKLWKDGRPAGIAQERRYFFARASSAFVTAAFLLYRSDGKRQEFAPTDAQFERFTAFLQILDSCTVRKTSPQTKKDEEEENKTFRALLAGVIGIHTFFELCCKEVIVSQSDPDALALLSFPSGS